MQQQPADVRRAALLRHEDVQRFGRARQGHVQQVHVVNVGVYQFAVVFGRETRFGHRPFVTHREAAYRSRFAVAGLRPDDVLHVAARLGVELPGAVGDDDGPFFEPFGLVDGGYFDGRGALFDAQRAVPSLLVPPAEEQCDVGDLRRREGDDLLVDGL